MPIEEKGNKQNDGKIISFTQQKRGKHKDDWTKNGNVNCNQESIKEHTFP